MNIPTLCKGLAGGLLISLTAQLHAQQGNTGSAVAPPKPPPTPELVTLADITTRDPQWLEAFVYTFIPDSAIEPEVTREDVETIEIFNTIRPMLDAGQQEQAFETLRLHVEGNPEAHEVTIFTLANFYWSFAEDKDDPDRWRERAASLYQQSIDKFPNYRRAHRNLSQIYMQLERPDQAMEHLVKAIELGVNDAVTYSILAYIHNTNGNYYSAEAAIRRALMLSPANKNYKVLLGQILNNQSRWEESANLFGELINNYPEEADFWAAQANAFLGLDRIEEAAVNLEVTRMMNQAQPQSLKLLGDIYINRQMYDLARQAYESSLETAPQQSIDEPLQAAETLVQFASYDNARGLISKIREVRQDNLTDKQDGRLLTLEAQISIALNESEQAVQILEELIDKDPLNGEALITLGNFYSDKRGQTIVIDNIEVDAAEKAIYYFERAEDHPEQGIVRQALIAHARMMVRQKRYGEASDLLERALAIEHSEGLEDYLVNVRRASQAGRSN